MLALFGWLFSPFQSPDTPSTRLPTAVQGNVVSSRTRHVYPSAPALILGMGKLIPTTRLSTTAVVVRRLFGIIS
jgi:hypothetical protein